MSFEIDPPDEPCPDCGSSSHRACQVLSQKNLTTERVRSAVENYCGHSWPDDAPLPEVCPECDLIVTAVMRVVLTPGGK
jgi:hypothetical protein